MLVSTSSALAQDLKNKNKNIPTNLIWVRNLGQICFSPDAVMTHNIISVIDCRYKFIQMAHG